MKTALVWFLVSIGGPNGNEVTYSPMLTAFDECHKLQTSKILKEQAEVNNTMKTQCIQLKVVVPAQ